GSGAPPAQERRPPPMMAAGDSGAAHEAPHRLRGLPGEQLDVVEAYTTASVKVFHELPAERDRLREALPEWAARQHVRNLVLSQDGVNEGIGVQRVDQVDLGRAGLWHGAAGPDGETQLVRGAQDGLAGGVQLPCDVVGRQAFKAI